MESAVRVPWQETVTPRLAVTEMEIPLNCTGSSGAALTIGASPLADAAFAIETMARSGELQSIDSAMQALVARYSELTPILRQARLNWSGIGALNNQLGERPHYASPIIAIFRPSLLLKKSSQAL